MHCQTMSIHNPVELITDDRDWSTSSSKWCGNAVSDSQSEEPESDKDCM
jgi:hypothetical protein